MTGRIRIAVAGGGLIAQVEHLPNLIRLRDRFEIVAVSDPSAKVRNAIGQRFAVPTVADAAELLGLGLDAMLIATPDPWHGALALRAIEAGLHVFCEKPLCYGPAEIAAIAAARDVAGVVVQVGYMKRFDPAHEAACDLVRGRGDRLRYVSVEVHDPDAWPFVTGHSPVAADDVPAILRAETARLRETQVATALGFVPDEILLRGFCGPYSSALVHDVNAVHGLLDAMGTATGGVTGATIFANGSGGQAAVLLDGGRALWTMAHFEVPNLADYSERIALYFDDGFVELIFPSPYLNHPARLVSHRSDGHRREAVDIRNGYGEAFMLELLGFADAVDEVGPARNPVEDAMRDQALLVAIAQRAAEPPHV